MILGQPPVEPSADLRAAAQGLRQLYVALRESGFSEAEACLLLGAMLAQQQE